jgi:hypothetical protein
VLLLCPDVQLALIGIYREISDALTRIPWSVGLGGPKDLPISSMGTCVLILNGDVLKLSIKTNQKQKQGTLSNLGSWTLKTVFFIKSIFETL